MIVSDLGVESLYDLTKYSYIAGKRMTIIRHIEIRHFRVIKYLTFLPKAGINCIIGPGDSGKSTLLDAIDLVLGARKYFSFSDADFYELDTQHPIDIRITLGNLPDELLSIDRNGMYIRGFLNGVISDEPMSTHEDVITVRLTVGADLDPCWELYSDRAQCEGLEKRLPWKWRESISPVKLGASNHQHLGFGSRSILNKLNDGVDVAAKLAELSRSTRASFAEYPLPDLQSTLNQVGTIAQRLGVSIGTPSALLDVNSVSLSQGAMTLHDQQSLPLNQLGTGSSRLLISGLQKAATNAQIMIVDEAEHGLEPFRISRLLHELGSKDVTSNKQVFLTSHSPFVLKELSAPQLNVLRKKRLQLPSLQGQTTVEYTTVHSMNNLPQSDIAQSTLRVCAEGFFSKAVIVCEGKTEVGLIRGIDLYNSRTGTGVYALGGFAVDGGGGTNYLERAKIFHQMGYQTSILQDSDIQRSDHLKKVQECKILGIPVFEWGNNLSFEQALISYCPTDVFKDLINYAVDVHGEQRVEQHLLNNSQNRVDLHIVRTSPDCQISRNATAAAAGKYSWFKDIAEGEDVGQRIIAPNLARFNPNFQGVISGLLTWLNRTQA